MGPKNPKNHYLYQVNSLKPSPNPNREKMIFFIFSKISLIWGRIDERSYKSAEMASRTPQIALIS